MRAYADGDDEDDDAILKDGDTLTVPMSFFDAEVRRYLQAKYPSRYEHAALCGVTDALGDDGLALNRPGYRFAGIDGDAIQARDEAWEERGRINRQAWRTPPPVERPRPAETGHDRRDSFRPTNPPRDPSRVPVATSDGFKPQEVEDAWKARGRALAQAWWG